MVVKHWYIVFVFLLHFTDCFSAPVVTVEGFVGGSAVFPCNIEGQNRIQDINVHWRDTKGKTVYDITGGIGTVEKQDLNCCFIRVFVVLSAVYLQVTTETVIGDSVVLPCSSAKHDLKDTDVHWRDNNDNIVYDIIKGKDSVANQQKRYKNRAETFPEEYERGTFSIKLNNLTHTDAGRYSCYITPSDEQKTIQLIINGVRNWMINV
ncbi:CD276 antigen-like protein [Labeo rohita]|uniref:CD276 antigen-like protein n=1 Tax=Labeo rohita TaxID=84645 RepID=A0A498NXJ0_LABRO|nr:CD276 antigen-like protein [Labeo rohita]